ncbi:MAG: DUF1972 domain-containing protein [Flavobacterium sp.]|nr:MAG: DUF1972 domain-containing protein [Flavobacterium sp.]
MMKVAIVGIRGIPNNYGGFETLAEQLVAYLGEELNISVYCSSVDMVERPSQYLNAQLVYIPVSSHGISGILYDSISLFSAVRKHDKVLFLGFGGGFVMPLLRRYRSKIILNIGGLDWKRNKWSPISQKVIKKAEALLVKNCGYIISDNIGIQKYIKATYGKDSTLIGYGGDQTLKVPVTNELYKEYPFLKSDYAFIVTRIQPDNNIAMLLEAFINQDKLPLVMVGNWSNSKYGQETKRKYINKNNVILLEAIYDRHRLDALRSNCTFYVHGHSAGGTNPSLVEAMYLELPIFAFASGYNEYTTENEAVYFKTASELTALVEEYKSNSLSRIGNRMKRIAEKSYRWQFIADSYKKTILQN